MVFEGFADILGQGGPAGEEKGTAVAGDLPQGVMGPAVGADDMDVLPGDAQLGAEIGKAADARKSADLVSVQPLPQLFGAAVKAHVAREKHPHRAFVHPGDGLGHLVRRDEGTAVPALIGLQQPGRADEHFTLLDGRLCFQRQGGRIAHAHPDEIHSHAFFLLSSSLHSSRSSPASCRGRSTTSSAHPQAAAASAFSRNPP